MRSRSSTTSSIASDKNLVGSRCEIPRCPSVTTVGSLTRTTSAPTGSTPEEDPFTVDNYAATVFSLIGVDPRKELMADGGRPIRVVNNNVIEPNILK